MDYDYNSEYNDEYDEIKRIVPDTSAIIEGNVEKIIKERLNESASIGFGADLKDKYDAIKERK